MSNEEWEVIKQGTWLYAGEVICDLRILKHGWSYGTGDYEDEEMIREDKEGEFYYIEYGSTTRPTEYKSRSGAFSTLEEAMNAAYRSTNGSVSWSK